jgi:hypothetical protein
MGQGFIGVSYVIRLPPTDRLSDQDAIGRPLEGHETVFAIMLRVV